MKAQDRTAERGIDTATLASPLQLTAVVALALCAHAIYWAIRPPDMGLFLEPWFAHIVHYGPVGAFAHPFSNYEPAYLYLLAIGSLAHGLLPAMFIIKLLSVAGSLFLALALADLLKAAGSEARTAIFVLVLPTVVTNAALFAQCDALWAGSCTFALAATLRGNMARSLVWCGIAIAFKSQAAFIAPVIIGAMIGRRAPLWQWSVPPMVFAATLLPAWLAGWPAWKLLTVYPKQAAWVYFPSHLANPWMAFTIFADGAAAPYFTVGYVAAAAAALIIGALAALACRDRRMLLLLGALSATALPFLLPKMLERYYFLGDVLALALALSWRTRITLVIAMCVQLGSLLSVLTIVYWYHQPYPALFGAVPVAAALVGMCRQVPAALWSRLPFVCPDPNRSFAGPPPASGGRTVA